MIKLSVVLPTHNRLERLKKVLAGLEKQDYSLDRFEVLVISDGSTDGTDAYLRSISTQLQLRPLFQKNRGAAEARNHGLSQAVGELVLFLDDDVVPAPELISEHIGSHAAANRAVAVYGPMLTPTDFRLAPWVAWEQALLSRQYAAVLSGRWKPNARQFYTGNASLPRKFVQEAGGFDPAFRRAEDVELAYRLEARGLPFHFNSRAVGYHYADRSYQSWLAVAYAYGRNDVIFTHSKGQNWLLPTIFREFWERHKLVRALVRLSVDRSWLRRSSVTLLGFAASLASRLGQDSASLMAYSGIYNLLYYQGIADEFGGRKKLFSELKRVRTEPS